MDRRLQIVGLSAVLALGMVGAAVWRVTRGAPAPPPPALPAPARPTRAPAPAPALVARDAAPAPDRAVLPASLDALRARLDARWRLRPDARFGLALQHLASLATPDAPAPEVRPDGARWSVAVRGAPTTTLPAEATFEAMFAAAVEYARAQQLPARLHLDAAGEVGAVTVAVLRDPWAAAREADARWTTGARSVSDLAAIGRALAWTAALTPDPLGVGDGVAARSLAALALLRAGGAPDAASEAVLCRAMTYTAEAAHRAGALSEDPAVGAWLRGDAQGLEAQVRDGDRTARWLRDATAPRVVEPGDLEAARRAAPEILARVLATLERDEAAMAAPGASPFARFAALETAGGAGGAWTDAGVTQARRRARWGEGLTQVLAATQAAAATPAQAQEVLAALGAADDPMSTEWLLWARERIVASGGAVARSTERLRLLGVPARGLSVRAAVPEGREATPAAVAAVAELAAEMDQRPAHRLALGLLLLDVAVDLPRAARMLADGTEQGPGVDAVASARALALRGDRAALLAFAREGFAAAGRVEALRALARTAGTDGAAQDEAWATLVGEDRSGGSEVELGVQWAGALVDRRDLTHARTLLERLSSSRRGAPAAARVTVSVALANVLLRLRDVPGAWRELEAWSTTDWTAPLTLGARVLTEQERLEDAERLARRAWERDEHAATAAVLAEIRWRRNDLAGAAEALATRAAGMSDRAWEERVGASFDAVFSGRSASEGGRAIDALGAIDVLRRSALLGVMNRAGHAAVAAEMHAHLTAEGATGLALLADRYALRAAVDGELAAAEWLQEQVPATDRADFADAAFARRLDELLWSVVDTPAGAGGDRVWLLRAASSLRRGADDPHRAELLEHLRASEGGTWAHVLARHLMDLSPLEAVRAQADGEAQQWQTGYYLGLKARAANEADAASDWMHASLDPGESASVEARWAAAALREWSAR